jgi:hypothetical protein
MPRYSTLVTIARDSWHRCVESRLHLDMPSRRNLYFTVIEKIQMTPQGNDREKYANVLQLQRAGMVEAGTGAAPNGPREPRSFRASH